MTTDNHLLWTAHDGSEHVSIYSKAEFQECFTTEQQEQLLDGQTIPMGGRSRVTHMTATARKARDTKPTPTFDGDKGDQPSFLAMINDKGRTDWLTCVDNAQDAEDAIREHMIQQHGRPEMVGWVVKVETFIHHPDA